MKKNILLLCCLLLAAALHAQSNYQPSKVITIANDTLNGWIDYKEWDKNPAAFKFADNAAGRNARTYIAKEVTGFEVKDKDYFRLFPVNISMDKVAPMEDLSVGPDRRSVKDTVWLRLARKGARLDLYIYSDRLKTRYYIRKKDESQVVELQYRLYYSPDIGKGEKVISEKRFREQLMSVAAGIKGLNTAKLSEMLSKTEYTLPAIARIVDFINGPGSRSFTPKGRARVDFYAGLALAASQGFYTGTHELADGAESKYSFRPKITAGLDLFVNPYVRKQFIRMDFSFTAARSNISKPMGDPGGFVSHNFDQYTFAFCPQFIYNIYNSRTLRANLGLGISGNYSFYRNSMYVQKYHTAGAGGSFDYEKPMDMEAFWFGFPLRAGVILRDRLDLYAQYTLLPSPVGIYNSFSVKVTNWQIGFNILLD